MLFSQLLFSRRGMLLKLTGSDLLYYNYSCSFQNLLLGREFSTIDGEGDIVFSTAAHSREENKQF